MKTPQVSWSEVEAPKITDKRPTRLSKERATEMAEENNQNDDDGWVYVVEPLNQHYVVTVFEYETLIGTL
jgi:hypothetical protein